MICLDLFCGAGLFSYVAKSLGMEVIGFESNPNLGFFHSLNFDSDSLVLSDIRDVDFSQYRGINHVHASPPCQAFSLASTPSQKKSRLSERDLIFEFVRAVIESNPSTISLEQVPSFVHTLEFNKALDILSSEGFVFDYRILNSSFCGDPQNRKRLILRASKDERFLSPSFGTFFPSVFGPSFFDWGLPFNFPTRSWYEAVSDLFDFLPITSFAPWQLRFISGDRYLSSVLDGSSPYLISRAGSRRLSCISSSSPAPTLRALGHSRHYRQWDYFYKSTLLKGTPRSFARLQSLPDSFLLPEDPVLSVFGLGNGIPFYLARTLLYPFF